MEFLKWKSATKKKEKKDLPSTEPLKIKESKAKSTVIKYNTLLFEARGKGKSTLLKQLDIIYNQTIHSKDLEFTIEGIYRNILIDIYELCKYNISLNYIGI